MGGIKRGSADLPLHGGKAPRWLFQRMVKLSESVVELIVLEHGTDVLLRRLSDPFWFQSLGCVLGFDWHSSGVTTTVCGALKAALGRIGEDVGLFAAGGKGRSALRTPEELAEIGDRTGMDVRKLVDISRLTAKVDSSLVQDGYHLYHHTLFFSREGKWCVIQQGMNPEVGYARRYHWLGEGLRGFVEKPHSGISADRVHRRIRLNLTDSEAEGIRRGILELIAGGDLLREAERVKRLKLPRRHYIDPSDLDIRNLARTFRSLENSIIAGLEDLLRIRGVGPKTVRALALVSEIVYGAPPSFRDPARYSYAHGGKDGHPYPVRRDVYDLTLHTLREAIGRARIGEREKLEAIRRLSRILND